MAYCWVHSHWKTTANLFNAQHSIQFVCIKRSFISARVLISTFNGLTSSSRMACWVSTLTVKVPLLPQTNHAVPSKWWYKQQHYVPFVSCWHLHQSAKAALKAIAEVQASADKIKPNNASSFDDKPSSTFQLVVASVNWKSKAVSNKLFRILCLGGIKSRMPFIFQLIVGSKQMHQTKLQQVWVDAWLSNTISGRWPNSHESNCASQLAAPAKCLRSQASCIAFGMLVCPSVASTNTIKANLDVGNLLFQIFKADSNFIRYSSSILWQINKMCDNAIDGGTVLLSMAPTICLNRNCHDGDVTQAALTIFCDTPRRLIVEYILLIPNSEGAWTHQAQLPSPTKPNDNFRLVVKFIPILIFDGARAPLSMLIGGCNYSEISLHFCEDFRIFHEGEWEVKDNGNAIVKQQSANSNYSIAGFQLVVKLILISNSEGA